MAKRLSAGRSSSAAPVTGAVDGGPPAGVVPAPCVCPVAPAGAWAVVVPGDWPMLVAGFTWTALLIAGIDFKYALTPNASS